MADSRLSADLRRVLDREPLDLPRAALVIARLEYPQLEVERPLETLAELGRRAADRFETLGDRPIRARISAINQLLFDEERFAGNRAQYDDVRNSLLNVVLTRKLGIPISLALVYMEVARRAGLDVRGVAFPGHFLMRVEGGGEPAVVLDPFDGGAEVDDTARRALLARHVGEEVPFDPELLEPCSTRHMLARMLNNLKRIYVEQRFFPQALAVTDLLLTVDPTILSELRDRGLLAYHLDDFPSALRDLQDYLKIRVWTDEDGDEKDRIWEHVKNLRRRVAGLN